MPAYEKEELILSNIIQNDPRFHNVSMFFDLYTGYKQIGIIFYESSNPEDKYSIDKNTKSKFICEYFQPKERVLKLMKYVSNRHLVKYILSNLEKSKLLSMLENDINEAFDKANKKLFITDSEKSKPL